MKPFLHLLFFLPLLLFSSCDPGEKRPEEVAETFLRHMNELEVEEAKGYATEETAEMLALMEGMLNALKDKAGKGKRGNFEEVGETEVNGDKAVVHFCCGPDGKENQLDLKKVDGEWKVHMPLDMPKDMNLHLKEERGTSRH